MIILKPKSFLKFMDRIVQISTVLRHGETFYSLRWNEQWLIIKWVYDGSHIPTALNIKGDNQVQDSETLDNPSILFLGSACERPYNHIPSD